MIWKDIEGYDGYYQVSDLGQVKSLWFGKERILKQGIDSNGYPNVTLCKDDKRKTRRVHQLVTEAFIGPRPDGYDTCHEDDVKANNVLSNLSYGTKSENYGRDRNRNNPKTSKYNGVYWHKNSNKWYAQVRVGGKNKYLGYFTDELEAARAFNCYVIANKLNRHLNEVTS